jgi:hypothetical protein
VVYPQRSGELPLASFAKVLSMMKLLPLTAVCFVLGAVPAPPGKYLYVDLQPQGNQKLADTLGGDGNELSVPKGEKTFDGVHFKIADRFLHLGSKLTQDRPDKIEGIKVGMTCVKIHILHATQFGNGESEDNPHYVADGTTIAEYKVRYDDGTSETIAVVYGEDVRDWWFTKASKEAKRGKAVWSGDNEMSKGLNSRIRLYLMSWENPHPDRKVATIDYVRVGDSPAAAFCVAMTLEAKEAKEAK